MALKPVVTQTSANFTRPSGTTQYSVGDLVANNATAGSVTPMSFTVEVAQGRAMRIVSVKLETSSTTQDVGGADFRLHLYATSPTVTNGDNAAFLSIEATHIGFVDLDTLGIFSDAHAGTTPFDATQNIYWRLATGEILYGLLEGRGIYDPITVEVFTVTLNIEHNQCQDG